MALVNTVTGSYRTIKTGARLILFTIECRGIFYLTIKSYFMFILLNNNQIIEVSKVEERHDGIRVTYVTNTLSSISETIPKNRVVSISIEKPLS